ncbi:MAG: energy-coupling factor transporter transmembrane protein EcfT [Lachnospiraceae bacterium]|nr:energy-coupling factor transporter transmembrane protein EcfT [Lachnospiraceae bacterium]
MKNSITIGQYYEADSVVHKLNPIVKIIAAILWFVGVFVINNYYIYLGALVLIPGFYLLAKVPITYAFRGLKPIFLILSIAILMNIFFLPGDELCRIWKITITKQGVDFSVKLICRLMLLVFSASLVSYTTTINMISKALEKIMSPLKLLKVPVHDIVTMITLAIHFIPLLSDEAEKIKEAQMSRGMDFESGNVIQRIRKMLPIVVPLFATSIKRADDIALAMDARCYNSGDRRTELRSFKMKVSDVLVILVFVVLLGVVIYLRIRPI